MTADRSNLVPESRTDKNGVTSVRWVNPNSKPALRANPLPSPAPVNNEQQQLYTSILDALNEHEDQQKRDINIGALSAFNRRHSDQSGLFRVLLENVESQETFRFIDQVYEILSYYGAESIPNIINEASLESVVTIIGSTEHLQADQFFLPEATRDMIDYALSSEDREMITQIIGERRPDNLRDIEGVVEEARRNKTALQSGVL